MISSNLNGKPLVYGLALFVILTLSCTRYYKPVPADTSTPEAAGNVITDNPLKYFILRQGKYSYFLDSISVDQEANTLNASLSKVHPMHRKYISAEPRKYGYSDSDVENEIHIYSKDTAAIKYLKDYMLPLDRIEKIEIIERDTKRTSTSKLIGAGITIAVIAGVIAAIAATSANSVSTSGTSCSCPLVSTFDGEQYVFQGEIYTGAITPHIEKPDYLPLIIQPVNGEYQIRISNDINERAFTDYAYLSVIEHNTKTQIGFGTDGMPYLLSNPVLPLSANLNGYKDVLADVRGKDQYVCSFDDTSGTSSINELNLSFQPPGDVEHAKLVLQLRNSVWLAFIYEQYASHFGKRYDDFQEKVSKKPEDEIDQWVQEQKIPLRISVSTASGWKEIENLSMVGMMANRELVIPVEVDPDDSNPIRLKLSTGFLFWELDYAAMDFTIQEPVSVTVLTPYSAVDEKGTDVLSKLAKKDGIYLGQYETDNQVTLKYKMNKPARPDISYSVVLLTNGYYELIRDYSGPADISFLKPFKEPEALSRYSKELFKSVLNTEVTTLTAR